MTWALLNPQNASKDSVIKKIVLGALYVKPSSKKVTATVDHIAEVYNTLRVNMDEVNI